MEIRWSDRARDVGWLATVGQMLLVIGPKRMRIAQVAPLYESVPPRLYGGVARVVSDLTDELVRRGHHVTLFAFRRHSLAIRGGDRRAADHGGEH